MNEIKKALYKEKPTAYLSSIKKDRLLYSCTIEGIKTIWFHIPIDDIGDAIFFPEMDAKLLIRYIVE